ncbi:MAG: hypothetical protein Q7S02_06315, partial [bacterium]|nr:hypothetical protein [bacterium]
RAIELAAQPAPEKITLPEIPAYPVPLTPEEAIIASGDGAPDGETMADGGTELDGDASPTSPLPVHIAIVLYELVRQRVGTERRAALWITKSAEEAGILTRHGFTYWSFTKPVLSEEHKVLIAQFLTFGGRIAGNMALTFYTRTDTPIPAEWEQLVTDTERDAFVTAFQARVAANAVKKEEKARRKKASAAK